MTSVHENEKHNDEKLKQMDVQYVEDAGEEEAAVLAAMQDWSLKSQSMRPAKLSKSIKQQAKGFDEWLTGVSSLSWWFKLFTIIG